MDRLIFIVLIVAVSSIGMWNLLLKRRAINKRVELLNTYAEKLGEFWQSGGYDGEKYGWMIAHSDRIQRDMGPYGEFGTFRAPYNQFVVTNYAIVLNHLPELRRNIGSRTGIEYFNQLQEALVRYGGHLEEMSEKSSESLRNPIIWFRTGVEEIITLPLTLLTSLGLISTRLVGKIINSWFIQFIIKIVALISFLSAIVGLVTGWEGFLNIAGNTLHSFSNETSIATDVPSRIRETTEVTVEATTAFEFSPTQMP